MTTSDSAVVTKYKRGEHPNSKANLKMWAPGEAPNSNGNQGPRIKPALQKFADMTAEEFKQLDLNKLTIGQLIALQSMQKAAFDAEFGDRMRIFITERLDGEVGEPKSGITNTGPTIIMVNDGRSALP